MHESYLRRRQRLQSVLGKSTALIHAGWPVPRNCGGQEVPFRASSWMLFFCGPVPAGSLLVLSSDEATLWVPPHSADDDVWEGPQISVEALHRQTGELCIHHRTFSPTELKDREVVSLPSADVRVAEHLRALMGRSIDILGLDSDLIDACIGLRLSADEFAEQELRFAADVTAQAHLRLGAALTDELSEREALAMLDYTAARASCGRSFLPIVTSKGETLHCACWDGQLRKGDLALIDFGAESPAGYAGDVTRTWPVGGVFSPTQRLIYDVVQRALTAATARVSAGVNYTEVHRAALVVIAEGLQDAGILRGAVDDLCESGAAQLFFPHGVGHLVGLDVHDMEELGDRAGYEKGRTRSSKPGWRWLRLNRRLQHGMCVTVEPGIYFIPALLAASDNQSTIREFVCADALSKFSDVRGIRVENQVLVTAQGAECLAPSLPVSASEVERAMAEPLRS